MKQFKFKELKLTIETTAIEYKNGDIENFYKFIIEQENEDLIFNLNLLNWDEMIGKLLIQLLHIKYLSKEEILKIIEKIENEVLFNY